MTKIVLKMTPEAEARDKFYREEATSQHINLAWLLQRSAGVRMDTVEPAPLYLVQAFTFLSEDSFQEDLFRAIWPGCTKS